MKTELGVIRMVNDRGYGFIVPSAGGTDSLFFHASQCNTFERLEAGMRVSFQRGTHNGKAVAVAVKVVEQEAST